MLQGHVLRGPGAGGGPEAHDEGVRRLYTRFIMMCLCVTGTCFMMMCLCVTGTCFMMCLCVTGTCFVRVGCRRRT